ncbi:Hypothetical_protein [Hexamita inflata]|uniref:Hypothetical_protein n=1 Tax=Hexamita inflata TaxID=28002 RepID=A0AA86QIS1_9EUKA|nr:Hypothetical protein HINF_LOCUS44682 [Hexamita inflata]CAI9957043.1 Hypothetical protein HINF_LOCUS44688 [Hexamita inflata]
MCIFPFIFNGLECECQQGFLIDGENCVDIVNHLKILAASDVSIEQNLVKNISEMNIQMIADIQLADSNLQRNTTNLKNLLDQQKYDLQIEIQSVNTQLIQFQNITLDMYNKAKDQINQVNNSANALIQNTSAQLWQSLISMNTSLRQQLDSQLLLQTNMNQTMYSMHSSLTTTIIQGNNYLQKQINNSKQDISALQNQGVAIATQINNINKINIDQNADIQRLKTQASANWNNVMWCQMAQRSINLELTGLCSNLNLCCFASSGKMKCLKSSYQSTYTSYSNGQCGQFIQF